MPPRPAVTVAASELPTSQTTHLQVTSIVYVTADIDSIEAARPTSLSQYSVRQSRSPVTHSTLRSPAPDATGVVFKLYEPPVASSSSNESGTPNHGAIIGGIIGGLAFLVLCLIIIARRRNKSRYQKRSASKKGSSRPAKHMATSEAINEAHRRRKDRNRRQRERQHDSPYGLTTADMAEAVHQGNVMVAEKHAHRSFDDVGHYISRPVAVAVPGARRPHPGRSDRPDSATLPASDEFDDIDLSDYYISDLQSSRGS